MCILYKITNAYDGFLVSCYPRIELITETGDWYLRLIYIPDGKREV